MSATAAGNGIEPELGQDAEGCRAEQVVRQRSIPWGPVEQATGAC